MSGRGRPRRSMTAVDGVAYPSARKAAQAAGIGYRDMLRRMHDRKGPFAANGHSIERIWP